MSPAETFCREVLAGRPPSALPGPPEDRAQTLRLLRAHRLLGLWVSEAEAASPDGRGPRLPEELRALVALQALRGTLTLEAADRAREALEGAGLSVLLFKGAGLIRAGVYPGPRARALGDADLLVHEEEAERAVERLEEAGFQPWVPWDPGRQGWLPAFTLSDTRAPAEMEVTLDLHWRVPYASYRSGGESATGQFWEGTDEERGVPSTEAHLLLTAEHFVRHLRVAPHLVALADMVRLLPTVRDPVGLTALARDRGTLQPLRSLLWLVEEGLGVAVEPALAKAVGVPDRVGSLRARALRFSRLVEVSDGRSQGRIPGLLRQAVLQGSIRDFLGELARVVHPPAEWLERRADGGSGGALGRRLGYWGELARWAMGRGASPLSPNQEFEGPAGRR